MDAVSLPVLKPETCTDCAGLCCRAFTINGVTRSDIDRLAIPLGAERAKALVSWDPGGAPYGEFILTTSLDPVTGEVGTGCPLHIDGACSVHEHRPNTCRKFEVGEPRCEKLKRWKN